MKGRDDLVGSDKPEIRAQPYRSFQTDGKIHNGELMLKEAAAGLPVLAAPFDIGEVDTVPIASSMSFCPGSMSSSRSRPWPENSAYCNRAAAPAVRPDMAKCGHDASRVDVDEIVGANFRDVVD